MGRIDVLIAAVSGTTLVGFVGFVAYAALSAMGVFAAPSVISAGSSGYGAEVAAGYEGDVTQLPDATYQRIPATLNGESVAYLDFGAHTPLTDEGSVAVAPIWVFIDGFDADGAPRTIPDHPTVLDVTIGEDGYSDLWDVHFVVVPDGFDSRSLRSAAEVTASGLEVIPAGMLVNCPLVDEAATTSEDHAVRTGWYRGEQVHYFDLGVSSATAGAVYEFVLPHDHERSGATPVPPLVVPPDGVEGESHFFRRYEVEVSTIDEARAIQSLADLEARGHWVRATGDLVNRPIVAD